MAQNKAELRQQLKQARLEMLDEEYRLASQAIVERLKQVIDWPKVSSLHYFEPFAHLLEVDINGFITHLEDTQPVMQLSTSRQIGDNWEVVGVHGGSPPDKFDVIIVPMLGFDPKTLQRLGYGGGYYDRLLATQPQARKIGVCFEQGRVEDLPAQPHDVPLNIVVTESRIHR